MARSLTTLSPDTRIESSQENSRKRKRIEFILSKPFAIFLVTSLKAQIVLLYRSASKATRVPVSGSSSSKKHLSSPEDVTTMMKVTGALVVVCVLALVSMEAQAGEATCRYWCRAGGDEERFYCCEDKYKPPGPVGVKRNFRCPPPPKAVCPPYPRFGRPATCSNDFNCFENDKCCWDECLEKHVCKPSFPKYPIGR
ncbi:uncharacterized protein LOC143029686 [Oratosquilla oratoria]|uniref:uncharacterized protein LOC143029686 n=1 Tax=Oratosquilla oratoria TaxID=337810 RepID=UPI003F77833D